MNRLICALLALTMAVAPGCGSVLFKTYQEVPANCENVATASFSAPAVGAGCRAGQIMRLDRRMDHLVEVKAEGYEPQTIKLKSEISVWRAAVSILLNGGHGIFTLFITTVIGVGADIKAGAWQVLEPELDVEMYRPGQGPPPGPVATGEREEWPSTKRFCVSCGGKIEANKSFCGSCGARAR